jgi:ATP-dependent Clp protease ATP-binding subunit ClpB
MDNALIAAVELSNRYITTRYLPDKAIDIIDEACSSTRVQLDSQPISIDILERRRLQLQIEATALEREKDDKRSVQRLQGVRAELKKIETELAPLKEQYAQEKKVIDEISSLQKKKEQLQVKLEKVQRQKNMDLIIDLQYGAIPEVEKRLEELKKQNDEQRALDKSRSQTLLRETITAETVTAIVARWTGIPVERLGVSERERILKLGSRLKERLVGQDRAVDAVCDAILRSRAGLSRPHQPTGSFLFLGPTGVGKTELVRVLATELFDTEKAMVRFDMSEVCFKSCFQSFFMLFCICYFSIWNSILLLD